MIVYHGTHIENIETLKPSATRHNAISKPVICFTPNPHIALFYIWDRSYKWVTFHEDENRKVVFTEHYNNMLCDFYHNVSGSIYECDGNTPSIIPTHMKGVLVSETPVKVEKETIIPDVYDEILKHESSGNIIIRRYNQLSAEEKAHISETTVRAIHMQKLLFSSEQRKLKRQLWRVFCLGRFLIF